jgi:hypothetical protein
MTGPGTRWRGTALALAVVGALLAAPAAPDAVASVCTVHVHPGVRNPIGGVRQPRRTLGPQASEPSSAASLRKKAFG